MRLIAIAALPLVVSCQGSGFTFNATVRPVGDRADVTLAGQDFTVVDHVLTFTREYESYEEALSLRGFALKLDSDSGMVNVAIDPGYCSRLLVGMPSVFDEESVEIIVPETGNVSSSSFMRVECKRGSATTMVLP